MLRTYLSFYGATYHNAGSARCNYIVTLPRVSTLKPSLRDAPQRDAETPIFRHT